MEPNQIILLIMIAVGIIFIIVSVVLSVREKNSDPEISARKQELKDEMDQMYVERARTAQKQLDESTKQALDEYVEEAKRELEVLMNEAKEYVEQLSAIAQSQMESCVTQTQEETSSIAEEMKAKLKEISAAEDEKIQQSFADVREEIAEHQKEASMAYTMISEKQNQLIGSIEHEQSRTKELAETVAQISADASFLQEELLPAAREAVPEIEKTQPETEESGSETEMPADTESAGTEVKRQTLAEAESAGADEFTEAEEAADAEAGMTEADAEVETADFEEETTEAAETDAEVETADSEEETTEAADAETEEAEAAKTADSETEMTEEEELLAERDFSETMEFDVVQPKRKADDSANLDLTKPIDRGEIREALHARESQSADTVSDENAQTVKHVKAADNAMPVKEEIDIDEVVVADVEEFDSIATETVKAAVQEVLSEEEGLLDYSETEWDTEAVLRETEAEETGEAVQTETEETAEAKEKPHGKKTSVVWNLSKKEKVSEPEEETIPEDMVIEDEPNKMLHAVRSSGTVSTEADLEMRKKVLNMYDRGSSSMEIAEKLGLGIGEVRMIIDLYSRRER